jgi:hypothetical protein
MGKARAFPFGEEMVMTEIGVNTVQALWMNAQSDALEAMADGFEEHQRTIIVLEVELDDDPPPTALPIALVLWEEAM